MTTRNPSLTPIALIMALLAPAVSAQAPDSASAEADLSTISNWVRVSDRLSTAGQIAYDQIEELRTAGYEVVVNLATAWEGSNSLEGFLVAQQGLTYVNIPVPFGSPGLRDLKLFFDVMDANEGRKVLVHCAANMRASTFVYLYRTLRKGEPEDAARADLAKVWDPTEAEAWGRLVNDARAHLAATR